MKGRRVVNAGSSGGDEGGHRWLYGLHAVIRRLEMAPRSVAEVRIVPASAGRRTEVVRLAEGAKIRVRSADEAEMRRLTGSGSHQGVAALASPYRYTPLEEVLARNPGPLLVLDQIQDPHNLGALLRTAAAVGMAGVILPERGAAGVTPSVEKGAAGAANDVPVCRVANLARSLKALRGHGYWSIALTPRGGENLFEMALPDRPALVLGGEGGIRPLVARNCDFLASIPLRGPVESLNASVAGAIAMYELFRRARTGDSPCESGQ